MAKKIEPIVPRNALDVPKRVEPMITFDSTPDELTNIDKIHPSIYSFHDQPIHKYQMMADELITFLSDLFWDEQADIDQFDTHAYIEALETLLKHVVCMYNYVCRINRDVTNDRIQADYDIPEFVRTPQYSTLNTRLLNFVTNSYLPGFEEDNSKEYSHYAKLTIPADLDSLDGIPVEGMPEQIKALVVDFINRALYIDKYGFSQV